MYYLTQPVFLKAFGDVDIVSSRKELDANGAIRAAFMGSFLSTASRFHGPHMEDVPGCEDTCPLCKNERGTWQHLMWECQANPPPVACPPNVLQRRFGWHLNSCDPDLNHAISGHIASTIQKNWHIRHPDRQDPTWLGHTQVSLSGEQPTGSSWS